MKVTIHFVPSNREIEIETEPCDTVDLLKARIYEKEGIKENDQHRLLFAGKLLEGHRTLDNYSIEPNRTIYFVPLVNGSEENVDGKKDSTTKRTQQEQEGAKHEDKPAEINLDD